MTYHLPDITAVTHCSYTVCLFLSVRKLEIYLFLLLQSIDGDILCGYNFMKLILFIQALHFINKNSL